MTINSVNCNRNNVSFKSNSNVQPYENPVNRGTERNLAILSSTGASLLAGGIVGGATTMFTKGKKIPIIAGIIGGLATLALILPPKLYNTKVGAFAKEKEMDVFSRQKEAQANIYADINNEINDENVSLDTKINHYSTVKMADNGQGVMIKGA